MCPSQSPGIRARTPILSCSTSLGAIAATIGAMLDPIRLVTQKSSKSANVRCTANLARLDRRKSGGVP